MPRGRERPSDARSRRRRSSASALAAAIISLTFAFPCAWSAPAAADAAEASAADAGAVEIPTREEWAWPTAPVRIVEPFAAPEHAYGPGHRGIDLAAAGPVRAPAAGVIAFAGVVVDRPLLTIDHGDGLVTTLEPVTTELSPGDQVSRGDIVGVVATGGSAPPGAVHFGVRLHGEYINPMLLLGGIPRAVLLPCC